MADMSKKVTVLEVNNDGSLRIPAHVLRELRFHPRQAVVVEAQRDVLVLRPVHVKRLRRIGEVLKSVLKDVEWEEIERSRQDQTYPQVREYGV